MFVHTPVFIGQSDQGKSPKIMILDAVKSHQTTYSGLMFTHEPAGQPVTCRFLMKESAFDRHTPAATRVDTVANFLGELTNDEVEGLRNRIDFLPEKPIYDGKGEPLRANDLPYIVGGLLKQGGMPQVKDDEGNLYNPADPTNFTFNSALKAK